MRVVHFAGRKVTLSRNEADKFRDLIPVPITERQKLFDAWLNAVPIGSEARQRRIQAAPLLNLSIPT